MKIILNLSIVFFITSNTTAQSLSYPRLHTEKVIDNYFGTAIEDEYRWIETDFQNDEINEWIEEQNKITDKYVNKGTYRYSAQFSVHNLNKHYTKGTNDHEYYEYKVINKLYIEKYEGGNQSVMYKKKNSLYGDKIVSKKQIINADNTTLIAYSVSDDEKYGLVGFTNLGKEIKTLVIVDIENKKLTDQPISFVRDPNIIWGNGGFFYTHIPDTNNYQMTFLKYHEIGTDVSQDKVIFKTRPNGNSIFHTFKTNHNKELVIEEEISFQSGVINVFTCKMEKPFQVTPLLFKIESNLFRVLTCDDSSCYFVSDRFDERGNIFSLNRKNPMNWMPVSYIEKDYKIENVWYMKDKFYVYLSGLFSTAFVVLDSTGKKIAGCKMPFGLGINAFYPSKINDDIVYISASGYLVPAAEFNLNIKTGVLNSAMEKISFEFNNYKTELKKLKISDSLIIPAMFAYSIRTKLQHNNPLHLVSYGGFNVTEIPHYNPQLMHFIDNGGVHVFVAVRGDGNNGERWRADGQGLNKINGVNDFIAASEFLIKEGYTSPDKLAISGSSHGGFLVANAMVKRPELFKAVVAQAGVFDMLRQEFYTVGQINYKEFGPSIKEQEGINYLLPISPYHNLEENKQYPATLLITGSQDQRVPPFHSYKFISKLQSLPNQKNAFLLKVFNKTGHSIPHRTYSDYLDYNEDVLDFIMKHIMN